jgi:hypothetical protein
METTGPTTWWNDLQKYLQKYKIKQKEINKPDNMSQA